MEWHGARPRVSRGGGKGGGEEHGSGVWGLAWTWTWGKGWVEKGTAGVEHMSKKKKGTQVRINDVYSVTV